MELEKKTLNFEKLQDKTPHNGHIQRYLRAFNCCLGGAVGREQPKGHRNGKGEMGKEDQKG